MALFLTLALSLPSPALALRSETTQEASGLKELKTAVQKAAAAAFSEQNITIDDQECRVLFFA